MSNSNDDLLEEYKKHVKQISRRARSLGLLDNELEKILKDSFTELKIDSKIIAVSSENLVQKIRRHCLQLSILALITLIPLLYVLLNVHTPTSSIVLRNVQGLTYPALKLVRYLSVPLIRFFPSLTDLYDESCLVENPHFFVDDMECWPCENVLSVIDLTSIQDLSFLEKLGEGTPFIMKNIQKPVSYFNLQELYKNYSAEVNSDSRRLKVENANIENLADLFGANETNLSSDAHIQWKINKMTAARVLRKLFPRPFFLPERSGQVVERYLTIDGPNMKQYALPNTECGYVFLIQGAGERTITLKPSKECENFCKTVSVHLKPSDVLVYTWWYWRPQSLPVKNATNLSISYMNSYC